MIRFFGILLFLFSPSVINAAPVEGFKQPIGQFIQEASAPLHTTRVEYNFINPRQDLPVCAQTPQIYLPKGSRLFGRTTVAMRCEKPAWDLFIPVQIDLYIQVVSSAHALSHQQTLQREDLTLTEIKLANAPSGIYRDIEEVIDKQLIGSLPAQGIITHTRLRAPVVIKAGDPVRIQWQSEGLRITNSATAITNAGVGETLRMRTPTGAILSGIVESPGVVIIGKKP